jgi:hypothetical protein
MSLKEERLVGCGSLSHDILGGEKELVGWRGGRGASDEQLTARQMMG